MTDDHSSALFIAPSSPFCRKVVVCIVEFGLQHRIDLKIIDPWTFENLRLINPQCKVPTLQYHNNSALFDSPVIIQYLQTQSEIPLIPTGDQRWDSLRREALADGLADAVIRRFVEQLGQDHHPIARIVQRQEQAITATLDHFERDSFWMERPVDVGHIALACAIDYLDRRSPELAWDRDRPLLARWFYDFRVRPSMLIAASPESGQFRTLEL